MRILHCCLSNFYIDGFGYQENILPRINQEDGNEVLIVASEETYVNGMLQPTQSGEYVTEYNVPIIRIPYIGKLPRKIAAKLRVFPKFARILNEFKPDIIMFHGTCGYELVTLAKYKKQHSATKIYVDSHEDYHNSARSFVSRNTLYLFWYKPLIRRTYKHFEKVLYITEETKDFLVKEFGLNSNYLEYYPLGGLVLDDAEYTKQRQELRGALGLTDTDILCIHSGRLSPRKKTEILLEGFLKSTNKKLRLIIIGSGDVEEIQKIKKACDADNRIVYVGWKSENELSMYLSAGDIYIQPGTQSVTMQNALCHRCAVMLYPYKSHRLFVDGNGFYAERADDITHALDGICRSSVEPMQRRSLDIAKEYLDYHKLSKRICE